MKSILVIDDEFTLRQVLRLTLEQEGYTVFSVWNGQDGLKVLADEQVDLIICDVMMPVMSGPQMIRALQQNAEKAYLPVILMSASGEPIDREGYKYDIFLDKPFHLIDLLEAVSALIDRADGS